MSRRGYRAPGPDPELSRALTDLHRLLGVGGAIRWIRGSDTPQRRDALRGLDFLLVDALKKVRRERRRLHRLDSTTGG